MDALLANGNGRPSLTDSDMAAVNSDDPTLRSKPARSGSVAIPLPAFSRITPHLFNGYWLAALVMLLYTAVFLITIVRFPYFSPFATVDETVNYYMIARNYLDYGFARTAFLQDLSTGSNPGHHPFIYNHMPPGPEIATALLMAVVGEQYRLIRLAFGVLFIGGVIYFLRFAGICLNSIGLRGAGYALLLVTPTTFLHSMDHPAYAAVPFLLFYPPVALHAFYATGRRLSYFAALLAVFIGSLYFVYQHALMALVCWSALALLRVVRFDRRDIAAFVAAALAGQLVHQAQTMVLFGPQLFVEDLWFTLSNRMFGVPTPEQLKEFYQSYAIVLHGTHTFSVPRLLEAVRTVLELPGWKWIATGVLLMLIWSAARLTQLQEASGRLVIPRDALHLGAIIIWAVATIALPLLAFPAFSADYALSGMNEFILGVAVVTLVGWAARELTARVRDLGLARPTVAQLGSMTLGSFSQVRLMQLVGIAAALVVVGFTANGIRHALTPHQTQLRTMFREARAVHPFADLLALGQHLRGQVVMTNVYPITATFFTREAGFGGCELDAFPLDRGADPAGCFAAFIRGYPYTQQLEPRYYVLFRAFYTGFTMCRNPTCIEEIHERVAERYPVLFDANLFTVFDLRPDQPPVTGPASEGQRVRLPNVGPWDSRSKSVTGLDAVYSQGRWIVDETPMRPVREISTGTASGSPSLSPWRVGPPPARYRLIRLQDEGGPYLRIESSRPADSLTLTLPNPLSNLAEQSISLRARLRASPGSAPALALNKQLPGPRTYLARPSDPESWSTVTLRILNTGPSALDDKVTLTVTGLDEGAWLDIRELSLFSGILP